jgi:hypothetical protein
MDKPLVSKEYPVGHLLNPKTPYVRSDKTDIRRTLMKQQELNRLRQLERKEPVK